MLEKEPPYSQKVYGILKELYGDEFTHTPESFEQKINSDSAYTEKVFGIMQEAYGEEFTHTFESFSDKLKKKEVSGQGSDPLTQNLPVKTVPQKIASKGQQPSAKPKPAPTVAAGDPFANQQAAAPVNYDPTSVRDAIKGVREGLDKTYRVAQEGKRKIWPATWNTQQAYSYIKPSVDYTQQMLDKIKDVQDPEIQSLYNDLNNANQTMKDMVGKAWNDGWDESSVNQYIGGLSRDMATKIDQVDRRMAQLQVQRPTAEQQQTQAFFEKEFKVTPKAAPKYEPKEEWQVKEEEEMAKMPSSGLRIPTEEELDAEEERMTYAERRSRFENSPTLKRMYVDYDDYEAMSKIGRKWVGEEISAEQWKEFSELSSEANAKRKIKADADFLEKNMGKRYEQINLETYQKNVTTLYDAWINARTEDPNSDETKSLAKDLRFAESQMEEAYRNLDLDYLESTSANQPTLTKEKIDRYNKIIKKIADEKIGWYGDGEKLTDADYQFLADTRRGAINAYATINNAKLIRLKEKSNLPGYSKDMAELSPLMQEIIGDQSMIKYASEQIKKKAEAEMAPIQEEYGKKRDEVSAYETQLNNIDTQIKQLEAAYQVAGSLMDQQQLEAAINQLQFERQSIYGSYETSYNALTELNKAMETAITPFNTELSNLQDPYNKKIQQLNEQISEIKRKNSVDDSVLAEADILYKNLASAQEAIKITNAQFNEVFYTEEYNRMLQEERKKGITSSKAVNAGSEFLLQFTNGMSQLAFGAMKLPKALGLEDSDEWGWVDDAYAAAVQMQNESSGAFGALQGNDVPRYLQLAGQIGQGVSSSLVYGLSGGISAPVLLTTTATTFVLSAGDNYQRAIDAGMDTGQAQIFANLISLVQSGAELIFNDAELFTSTAGNTILTNVIKNGLTVKQAFKIAMKDLPRKLREQGFEVWQENLEEITSLVAENMALNATNVIAGKKYFDDNLTKGDFEDTFITTAGSTLITQFLFSGSGLDPNTRMALFKSVQNSQKILDHAEKIGVEAKKLAQLKKDVEDAKLKLSVCESHTNWGRMNDSQKAYAFDVARQLSELEKARKNNEQNGVVDESLTQRAKEAKEELNEALNNPEAVEQREKTESNTREVLEAIKNGENYPQQMTQHPNWNRLSDEQKKEVESLAEDLEEKQSEINGLSEVGLEDQSIVSKRNEIQDKISEILNNPKNDQENIQGVSGEVGVGQEPVAAQPLEGTSGETTEAGGVLQAPGQEEVVTTTEAAPETTVETETPATETVTRISEVAPAVRRAGAVEASEGNNQNAGVESALEGVGMDNASLDEWKKKNKAPSKKGRIEELTQAVRDLISGKIKFKEYYEKAKKLMPSKLMDKVPTPATNEEIVGSIDKNKLGIGIINLNKFVKKGMKVGLRIDIPAFNNFGKNVVTVHDRSGSGQPVVGYGSTGSIQNVNFRTSVSTASKIGAGESKSAFAMAEGQWMDESPESIQKRAEEALNSPEWVQVGMNPTRNSFFFDKSDGNPILSADEVLQVGNLVLAKNPKKIDLNTEEGMAQFEKQFSARSGGVTYQFRESEETTGEEAIQEDESVERAEETNPEIIKIEEERAAELEAFENDENLTEIDGEQVLLTPDGRITRDTINEKYDKEVEYQREIESVVAEIKKQQDPEYQEALRKAIDADPKAGTNVHQMAAENILSGMSPNEAIATATEQAAQKARTDKARQAMEREGLVSNKEDVRKAIANVMRALRSTGIRVRDPLPPGKFEEERKKAKASDTAEAWFRSKTGEIVFSQKALEDGWGTTIVFHEGTHPILNIIRNTNRPLYNKAIKGLRAAAKAEKLNGKPNPLKDVEAWVNKAAGKKSQEQQDDEFMTETIARLASGDIEIKRMPATLKEKFVEVLNRIAKFMGFKRIFLNSPDYEFRRLANQIATTLAKGEKIEKIVGKRNVKKYQAKFGAQETTSAIFDDVASKLAALGIKIGGDKKQKTNFDVGKALKEYYKKKFKSMKIDDFGKNAVDITSDYAVDEIIFALNKFGNNSGKGWYTQDFEKALDILSRIDPDIKNNPKIREISTVVIAIASNSTDVLTNLTRVIYAVDKFKKTGKIPTDVGTGKGASAIATGISRYNLLLDKFGGDVDKVKQFMQTVGPIKDIKQQLIDLTGKKNFSQVKDDNLATDPEWNDTEVLPGSILIFGPKIGAFYSNLSGLGGTPTIDRWCIRTMYRYRGDMMAKVLPSEIEQFKKENGLEGQSDGSVISLIQDHAKMFNDILGGKGQFANMSKADRNLALKPYRKGSQIAAKMSNVVNEISDGLNEKINNKAQYSKDFRSFTKKVFEQAQKKIKEQTGQDLQISDIQAILWIYEKELFGAMGVKQRPDSTYSSASERLLKTINSGVNTIDDFKNGKAKVDKKSMVFEEGPMGDIIPIDTDEYFEGLENQPERLNENADLQPSDEAGRGTRKSQERNKIKSNFISSKVFSGANENIANASDEYKDQNDLSQQTPSFILSVPENDAKRIADAYEEMKHDPDNPQVKQGFNELITEIKKQAEVLLSMGYNFQLSKEGEGYGSDSKKMADDVRENKRIFVDPSSKSFGTKRTFDQDNIGLQDSGYKDANGIPMTNVELIRAVHDLFGHAEFGNGFGPIGEENAWRNHMSMFTPLAQKALTSTTRGQNSWVNFGPHMRNADGSIKKSGDKGYMGPSSRPFAEQKMGFLPEWAMDNAYGDTVTIQGKPVTPVNKYVIEGTEMYEINDGNAFYEAIKAAKESRGADGIQVSLKSAKEYQDIVDKGGRLIVSKDGLAGLMVEADGNVGSGFAHADIPAGKNTLKPLLIMAIKLGGRYTDAYDTYLPPYYAKFGFKPFKRIKFNEEFADEGWEKTTLASKPDVVVMYWDGGSRENLEKNYGKFEPYNKSQGEYTEDYDAAIEGAKEKSNSIEESASLVPPKVPTGGTEGNARISKALGIDDTIQPSDTGRGYRGLPGKYIEDYNGIQYFAENEKYAGVFGKNIVKANISKNKILDLAKWNKKLKDAGIPDNGMGQPFLTVDQSMFDENRNFTTKGREGTFGKMKRAIGLDEFNKFKEEFDNAEVIYGQDAGNVGEMVYAVRDPKAIDLIDETIQPSEIVGRGEKLVRSGEITESDRQIALYAIQNKIGIKTTHADMIRVSKMSPEQKIKLIEDAFQDRVKKMNPAFRDPETRDQNRFYQNAVDAKNRALALVPKETIQPTEPGRYDKKDIPDLIERAVAGIDADLRKGIPLLEAIENNMTNQDWYPLLTDKQKRQVQTVLETTFEEEIASLPTEKEEAAEIGVDENIRELTSELEDLYYQIRDGRRNERNRAQARRDEILRGNPKLSYIYKNIDLINAQLEERGLLTKSIGCP